jgi:hypothetical protein
MARFRIVILFLISCVFVIGECGELLTKQQQWDHFAREVDSWTDGLGSPIDPGIKETVIVLNLLGFPTRQSCEGHLDHGNANPWIDLSLDHQPQIVVLQDQVSAFVRTELTEQLPEGVQLKPAFDRFEYLRFVYQKEANRYFQPLFELLDEFYQTHEASEDDRLSILVEGVIRLSSSGGRLQEQRSESERAAKLQSYRDEMNAFTQFLKQRLFASD